ncbi:MAG: prepilin-type N-terminal cleavage/methylation domain-containing protein [Oceanisphaera sp.]|uniref:prepilin-type N-terminal cleavage/methylation domain-containing protein n=1 Tax=Oceanisphaera sp. TaxID=1929979 RepID=UPI003C723713
MKCRGFTLLELVIVLVLIAISSMIGLRFISDMAYNHVSSAERGQALAGARFAIERLRRELRQAYSPSVYVRVDNKCISYVPVIAAGTYTGQVQNASAEFILPVNFQKIELNGNNMAINAPSAIDTGLAAWQSYPADLPENVVSLKTGITNANGLGFADLFDNTNPPDFLSDSSKKRYTLLKPEQVRFCVENGKLKRATQKGGPDWENSSLMLTGLVSDNVFGEYSQSSQLVTVDLTLATRDGNLVLSSQLQVGYEP